MDLVLDDKVQQNTSSQSISVKFDFLSPLVSCESRDFLSKFFMLLIELSCDFFGASRIIKGDSLSRAGKCRAYEDDFSLGYMTDQLAHCEHAFFGPPIQLIVRCCSQYARRVLVYAVPIPYEAIGIGAAHCFLPPGIL